MAVANQSTGRPDVSLARNCSIWLPGGRVAGANTADGVEQTSALPIRRNEVIFSGAGCATLVTSYSNECAIEATEIFIADYDVAAVSVFPLGGVTKVSVDFLSHYLQQTGSVMSKDKLIRTTPPAFEIVKVPLHSNSTYVVKLINIGQACTFDYSLTTFTPDSLGEHNMQIQ